MSLAFNICKDEQACQWKSSLDVGAAVWVFQSPRNIQSETPDPANFMRSCWWKQRKDEDISINISSLGCQCVESLQQGHGNMDKVILNYILHPDTATETYPGFSHFCLYFRPEGRKGLKNVMKEGLQCTYVNRLKEHLWRSLSVTLILKAWLPPWRVYFITCWRRM